MADGRAALLANDAGVAQHTLGVYDLLIAAGLNSQRRALGTALLERGRPATGERGVLGGFGLLVELQTDAFRSVTGADTLELFQAAGVEASAGKVDLLAQRITGAGDDPDVAVSAWIEATTRYLARARQVIRTAIDSGAAAIAALRAERADGSRRAAAVVAAVLVAGVLLLVAVGYGLTVDVRRLRDRMRFIADRRLPQAMTALGRPPPRSPGVRDPAGGRGTAARTRDEIGELSALFESVQADAVRLATTQAALRITTAGVAQTLSRRSQKLIARQLALITELEKQHADPTTLERLFELDHLAVRVRRHGDNMLVLTGAGPGWRWPRPATLTDVVKAAAAATEQYRRVEVAELPAIDIVATAIVDLILIFTELIDNATRFSHPDQPVSITAGWLADEGVRVEVHDVGYGLGTRSAAMLNARLSSPAVAGIGDEQTIGLHVVSVLAARTGVDVNLVPVEDGCVATVAVPAKLLTVGAPPGADGGRPGSESADGERPVGVAAR